MAHSELIENLREELGDALNLSTDIAYLIKAILESTDEQQMLPLCILKLEDTKVQVSVVVKKINP